MNLKYTLPIKSNNYIGIIGAIIGGLLGAGVNLLILYLTDIFFSLTFALIPLGIYYGYLFFKGRVFKQLPIVIIVLSLILTIVLTLSYEYILLIKELTYDISFSTFMELVLNQENLPYLLQDMITPILFIALGIWVSWKKINESL